MSRTPHGGSTPAVRVFVTICFSLWVALSYLALFALATVFWVAMLESRVNPTAFAEYAAALVLTIASAIASLWVWKRVHDRPWLYVTAAWVFGIAIALSAAILLVVRLFG